MYKELILESRSNGEPVVFGQPCGEQEIAGAEEYVGCVFPDELKELLQEMNGDGWLILSTEQIIRNVEMNRRFFPECFDSRAEYEERIDRHVFFATNGCGDYYCYRINEDGAADESGILIWEHELFECRYAARDIKDLIVKYYHSEI